MPSYLPTLAHILCSREVLHGANFVVFADRAVTVKARTTKFSRAYYGLSVDVVSPECRHKI